MMSEEEGVVSEESAEPTSDAQETQDDSAQFDMFDVPSSEELEALEAGEQPEVVAAPEKTEGEVEETAPAEPAPEIREEPTAEEAAPQREEPKQVEPEAAKPVEPDAQTAVEPEATVQPEDPFLARLANEQESLMGQLAQHYALDEKTAEDLGDEELTKLLPQLMAKTHLGALETSYQSVLNVLPDMVKGIVEQAKKETSVEDAFFAKHTDFDRTNERHIDTLSRYAQAFRAANPQMSQEDLTALVVNAAKVDLGIQAQIPRADVPPKVPPAQKPQHVPPTGAPGQASGGNADMNPFAQIGNHLSQLDEEWS